MTKFKLIFAFILISSFMYTKAQTYLDVLRYSQPQQSGTARSMAMGGAFGSLGGDYGALSINPAGIAAYRSSEFTFTPSIILSKTSSDMFGSITDDNKTSFAINQIGYVGTYRPIREVTKGLVSSHFSIGYSRNNNFNYRSMANALNVGNSISDMFVINANGIEQSELRGLTGLAYDAYIIDYDPETTGFDYTNFLNPENKVHQTKIIDKDGYTGEINISAGANISNILLIGGSFNLTMLNYNEESNYYEQYSDDNDATAYDVFERIAVKNSLEASGNGINLKLGFIVKPIKGLRLGAAYHTPTWYNIEEKFGDKIDGLFFNTIEPIDSKETSASYKGRYDYNFNTPGKYIASTSYIFGKLAIISFDYEYIDYSKAKFKSTVDEYNDVVTINEQNNIIKDTFTATQNFRIGTEFRVNKQVSLRAGYDFQGSPYKTNPKDNEIISYSAGFGFRSNNYFLDVAYKLSSYDINYYNYNWSEEFDNAYGVPSFAKTESKDHNLVLTFGVKF